MNKETKSPMRFPRLDVRKALEERFSERTLAKITKGIPVFDPSKVRKTYWLIKEFLANASVHYVWGEYGTFKSTFLTLAAWHVSQGKEFLGMKTRQRPVLYLDYENPEDVIANHCRDLQVNLPNPMFIIWDRFHGDPPPQPTDERLAHFIKKCKKETRRCPWLIFDSWTSLLKSGSDKERSDTARIFQSIRQLTDLGATVTVIDHSNRGGKYFGSEAKMTQMDATHQFEKFERTGFFNTRTDKIRVKAFLKRYAPEDEGTFSFEVKSEKKGKRWHIISLLATKDKSVLRFEQQVQILRKLLSSHPKAGEAELAVLAALEKDENNKQIISQKKAVALLQAGVGRYWTVAVEAKGRKAFRLIKEKASSG